MSEVLEKIDVKVHDLNHIRMTVYTNDEDKTILCVIDLKTLLHSLDVGYFVEFVPCIIKHIHYVNILSETSPATLTVVPNQSFRIVKTREEAGSIHVRVCIIPPQK